MNFQILIVRILHHIVLVEIRKPVIDQLVAISVLEMLKDELGKAGQESAGLLLLIHLLQELLARKRKRSRNADATELGHFMPQVVYQEPLADVCPEPSSARIQPRLATLFDYLLAIVLA